MTSFLLISTMTAVFLSMLFLLIHLFTTNQMVHDGLLSPFECGFAPGVKSRKPFSLRFFLLSVLFLIFDVELAVLVPLAWSPVGPTITYFLPVMVFLAILMLGLVHELNEGSLTWQSLSGVPMAANYWHLTSALTCI